MTSKGQSNEDFAYLALATLLAASLLLGRSFRNEMIYWFKYLYYFTMALIVTTICIPVFLLRPRNVNNFQLFSLPTVVLSRIIGVYYEVRNKNNITKDGGAVIVCNHQNSIDVIAMLNIWGLMGKCTIVAKRTLFFFWPFGLSLWLAGVIFIDRRDPVSSYRTLQGAAKLIKKGTKMIIFPEGTRNTRAKLTRTMLPFKKGAFSTAISCQVPIVPVVNSPYYYLEKLGGRFFGRGTVITEILEPIETTGLTENDVEELLEKTWTVMQKKYEQLAEEMEKLERDCKPLSIRLNTFKSLEDVFYFCTKKL